MIPGRLFILVSILLASTASAQTQPASTQPATSQPAADAEPFDNLPPERGVVLDVNRSWSPVGWAGGSTIPIAESYSLDTSGGTVKFVTAPAKSLRSWYTKIVLPIDTHRYPIIVMRLRVKNAATDLGFNYFFFDDGTGANGGGLSPFGPGEIKPDKDVNELRTDARSKAALGPSFNAVVVYVCAQDKAPAEFEIVGLRFETPPDAPAPKPSEDEPLTVSVFDEQNNPVAGATVVADQERRNWARRATTDAKGNAVVTPLANETGQHMLWVDAPGKVPAFVEPRLVTRPTTRVLLRRGQYYGGRMVDPNGRPVALARVGVSTGTPDGRVGAMFPWCYVLTDARGEWRTPIMPALGVVAEAYAPNSAGKGSARFPLPLNSAAFSADTPAALVELMGGGPAAPPAGTDAQAAVYLIDGRELRGTLAAVADGVLTIQPEAGDKVQAPLLDLDHLSLSPPLKPTPLPGQPAKGVMVLPSVASAVAIPPPATTNPADMIWRVTLLGGDRLTGSLTGWADGKLTLAQPAGNGLITIPDAQIAAIWRDDETLIAQAAALKLAGGEQDTAFVQQDEHLQTVSGVASGIDGDSLVFRYDDQPKHIALTRLVGLVLSPPPEAVAAKFMQTVQLTDGQTLSGQWVGVDAQSLTLRTAWGQDITFPLNRVATIRTRNGRLVYLSDLEPSKVEEVPYFDRVMHYRRDTSLIGGPLRISGGGGGQVFAKGLAVHSRCVLHYDLGKQYERFGATLGFDETDGKLGRAAVRVLGDGKPLFEQADARGDQPAKAIDVDVKNVSTLELEVDFGQGQDVGDRVIWGDAKLIRAAAAH